MKAILDFTPPQHAAAGFLGSWRLVIFDDAGHAVEERLDSLQGCLRRAKVLGLKPVWTKEAKAKYRVIGRNL